MSYHGSEIDWQITKIVRWWARLAFWLALSAFSAGLFSGLLLGRWFL